MTCPTAFTYEEAAALWRELRDIKETLKTSPVSALTAAWDDVAEARNERDAARRAHKEALERIATLSQEVADAHKERLHAIADRDRANTNHAGTRAERDFYRAAIAEADAAAREARAERDTLARALAAVRAVVAMVPGVEE